MALPSASLRVLQCVIVRRARSETLARTKASQYALEAASVPGKRTSTSWRFELMPAALIEPQSWFAEKRSKEVTLVWGHFRTTPRH